MQKFGNLLIMVAFVLTNLLSYCEPAEDTFCKYLRFHGRGGNYDGVVVLVEFSVAFKLGLFIYLFVSLFVCLFIPHTSLYLLALNVTYQFFISCSLLQNSFTICHI